MPKSQVRVDTDEWLWGDMTPEERANIETHLLTEQEVDAMLSELFLEGDEKGGPGSGHFGHRGRVGQRGGSAPGPGAREIPLDRPPAGDSGLSNWEIQQVQLRQRSYEGDTPEEVAENVIEYAKSREPEITKTITDITENNGGKNWGLDYRIKSGKRTSEKIQQEMDENPELSLQEAGTKVTDVIRYTALFDAERYAEGTLAVHKALNDAGFEIYDERASNYWKEGNSYKGYNCVFEDATGFKFEFQFHTPKSIIVKEQSHRIYQQTRAMESGPERLALMKEMTTLWEGLDAPPGWQNLHGWIHDV